MTIGNIVRMIAVFSLTNDICYMADRKDIVGLE